MTPTIKAEPIDSPVVRSLIDALNAELTEQYPEEGANHFRLDAAELAPERGAFLVAYVEGAAVGCGAVRLLVADAAEIKRMYIAPACRGRGLATVLLAQLEAYALRLGARRLVLETGERQRAAVSLYRRSGFVEIPRFGEYVDSPLSLCMAKELGAKRIPTKREVLDYVPPAGRLLGREVIALDQERGTVTMRYTAQPEFLNRHGTVQGGMLAAMLDSSTSLALYTVLPPELTAVTTNLNVSYHKPGKLGPFTVIARVVSRDDRDGQTSGELLDEEGVLVATAIATLRIIRRRESQ